MSFEVLFDILLSEEALEAKHVTILVYLVQNKGYS